MYGYIYFTKSKFKEKEEITLISGKPKKKKYKKPPKTKKQKKNPKKTHTNKNQYLSPSNPKQTNKQKEKMKPYSPKKKAEENREAMSHSHQDSIVFSNIKHKTKKFREINGVFFVALIEGMSALNFLVCTFKDYQQKLFLKSQIQSFPCLHG